MRWNWFGRFGLLALCVFQGFQVVPKAFSFLPYTVGSVTLLLAMITSVASPIVAGMRSSKWWLLVTLCGLCAAFRFFAFVSA